MTDFATINPNQLPMASAIADDALVLIFRPNGPLQKIPVKQLLAKLISTDLVRSSKAVLDADLAWAADKVALVHNDPSPFLNGWYRKIGGAGAGNWTQFETLAKAARDETEVARSQATAAVNALIGQVGLADQYEAAVAAEVAAASAGAWWKTEKPYLFQDAAGTVPVVAVGDPVGCIKSRNGVADYDLIQADNAKRGTYFEAYGIGFVRYNNAQGYYSRADVSLKCPSFIAVAARFAGTTGRYIFGYVKNTNSRHILASATLGRLDASAFGAVADLNRPWVQAFSANHSCPIGPVGVYHSLLGGDGKLDAVFEDSQVRDAVIEKATTWVNGDTIVATRLALNGVGATGVNADASGDFFGGVVMARAPTNRSNIARWLQARSRPRITADDEVIVIVGDSTGDDVVTETSEYGAELPFRFAQDSLVPARPNNCVILWDWCRTGESFIGMQRFSNGNLLKRTFVVNCSSAGSQPGYFFGERFEKTIGLLPKVDYVIWNHGHNLVSGDGTIQADPNRKYLRAGQYLDVQDQFRDRFPKSRQIMIRTYPRRTDNSIEPVVAAVDHVAAKYGDVALVDLYSPWIAAGKPVGWYHGDGVHPSVPTGVTEMLGPLTTVFNALPALATNTPPLIAHRKALPAENLLANGALDTWTAGLPDSWALFGDATVAQVGARARVTANNGGLAQTINAVPLRGKIVTLVVSQEIAEGSDLFAGWVRFTTDVGAIGDGRWSDGPYRSHDVERLFYFHFPVPAAATTLTIQIMGGSTGAGTLYIGHAMLATGDTPMDLLR